MTKFGMAFEIASGLPCTYSRVEYASHSYRTSKQKEKRVMSLG
jgi:hypothetical protein